ncbi:MAG: hypothetical protein Q7L55_03690 [Actinomycetota bacterium]|nr:hypothetical protein [Actinomycetota bacterium]
MLKPEDLNEPEDRAIEAPAELADSISEYEWKWAAGERDVWGPYESAGRTALHDNLWPMLEAESWQVGEKGRHYFLQLGPNVKVHAEWEAQPLLSYSIQIHRKQCLLRLIHPRQGFSLLRIEPYLRENASVLVGATGRGPEGDVVLRLPGHGLDEDMPDWAVGLGLIKRAIAALEPTISGLLEDASKRLQAERDRAAKQREFERTRPERQRHEIARRTALHNSLWPILKMEAWQIEPGREHSGYFLPLGPNVKIHSFVNPRPVLFYAIHVHKKHSVLRLLHPLEHLFRGKIEPYLQGNASILTQVIGKEPKDDLVLGLPGHGWDDEGTDWAAGLSGLVRKFDDVS